MNTASLVDLVTALAGLVAAVTALVHSIQTRKRVSNPPAPPAGTNGGSKPGG